MDEKQFISIAKELGISKSTVSKAARHCSGVASETRQQVLDVIARAQSINDQRCDIYCILPDVPQYFWNEVRRGIVENLPEDVVFKLNIFTKLSDEATILTYLEEAEQIQPSVIILSAWITERIHQVLLRLISKTFILFLSEAAELTNSFYIGSDPYADGYAMGRLCRTKVRPETILFLSIAGDRNAALRTEGFCNAMLDSGCTYTAVTLNMNNEISSQKYAPSHLARILAPYTKSAACIFSPVGNPALPLAVRKAGFSDTTALLCHDTFCMNPHETGLSSTAIVNQDVYAQGRAAMKAAEIFLHRGQYPSQKKLYIPSVIQHTFP